jgi:hypothetical protein
MVGHKAPEILRFRFLVPLDATDLVPAIGKRLRPLGARTRETGTGPWSVSSFLRSEPYHCTVEAGEVQARGRLLETYRSEVARDGSGSLTLSRVDGREDRFQPEL